jgi:spermidine synthase
VAVLGFAAGGVVGPLRALGNRAVVEGVDLDPNGYRLFNRMCSPWAGDVRFERADALSWLASRETQADVILDDLSVPSDRDVIKPRISWVEVPGLARNRLSGRGVVVLNWLPPGHESWRAAIRVVAALFPCLRVLFLEDFENRILLGGQKLPPAHDLSRAVRNGLLAIGSRQAGRVAVRTWPC